MEQQTPLNENRENNEMPHENFSLNFPPCLYFVRSDTHCDRCRCHIQKFSICEEDFRYFLAGKYIFILVLQKGKM